MVLELTNLISISTIETNFALSGLFNIVTKEGGIFSLSPLVLPFLDHTRTTSVGTILLPKQN